MGILEKIRKGKKRSKGEKRLKTIFGKHQMRKRSKVNKLLRRIKGRSTAGEETARKIDVLLNRTRVKTEKIISLIRKWLSLLPGVNKFFLEKEAKKKAEEIIKLKED